MKKSVLPFTCFFFIFSSAISQNTYQQLYNSLQGFEFQTYAISSAWKGKILLTGAKFESPNKALQAVYLIDENGKINWGKYFIDSAAGYLNSKSKAVLVDKNSSIIVRQKGYEDSVILMLKIDNAGNKIWNKSISGLYFDKLSDVKSDGNGNILITGTIFKPTSPNNQQSFLLKINGLNGDIVWIKTIQCYNTTPNDGREWGASIAITKDKGCVITIISQNGFIEAAFDYLIAKYDVNGNIEWTKRIKPAEGNQYSYDDARGITTTLDGGYVFTGDTRSSATTGVDDVSVIKLNSKGDVIWAKQFDNGNFESGFSILKNPDSSFIISGSGGVSTYDAPFIMCIDKNGQYRWLSQVKPNNTGITYRGDFSSILKTKDCGYAMICEYYPQGQANPNVTFFKFDNTGNSCSDDVTGKTIQIKDLPYSLPSYKIAVADFTNKLIVKDASITPVSGRANSSTLCQAILSIASSPSGNKSEGNGKGTMQGKVGVTIFPNPTVTNFLNILFNNFSNKNIELSIISIDGKKNYAEKISNTTTKTINVSAFAPGMYIITAASGKEKSVLKFIKQ